jgi:hypothetical protein
MLTWTRRGRATDAPAVRGRIEDDPPINRDDRADNVLVRAGPRSRRRFLCRGREHTRADLEGRRRGEPGQGEESAHLYATGDERGRIGPLSLTSVGEWSVVRVLALG